MSLTFSDKKPVVVGFTDADMTRDVNSKKSISSIWSSSCKELFIKPGFKQDRYVLFCDNQSVIHLGMNSTFHVV